MEHSLDQLEDFGNQQLHICKDIIKELSEKSGCSGYDCGGKLYTLSRADYCEIDRWGSIDLIDRGYGGDPDTSLGELTLDPLILEGKLDEFKTKFRAEALPKFNKARDSKRAQLLSEIKYRTEQLAKLQGDIE